MKLAVILIYSVGLCLFSCVFSSVLFQISQLDRKILYQKRKTESMLFISESFCNYCGDLNIKNEDDFNSSMNEWSQLCERLWSLEKIEWKCSKENNSCGNLYHASWTGPYGNGEVYAIRQVR